MPKPKIWGKSGWIFLTCVVLNYPDNPTDDDKKNYFVFFNQLKYVLPCNECQNNFTKHIEKRPLTDFDLESREKLLDWFIDIQNMVNSVTGAKILTNEEARENINKMLKSGSDSKSKSGSKSGSKSKSRSKSKSKSKSESRSKSRSKSKSKSGSSYSSSDFDL